MYTAKLALAIVLAGGVAKENESGNYINYVLTFIFAIASHEIQFCMVKKKEHVFEANPIFC